MKKIFSLVSIIFLFALICAFVSACGEGTAVTTPQTIPGLGTTGGSTTAGVTTVGTTTTITAATTSKNTSATTTTANVTTAVATTTTATTATSSTTSATTTAATTTTSTTVATKDFIVFLDPGHGGSDPGVVRTFDGVTYYESEINLSIALKTKAELEKRGYTVVMSRKDDTYVSLNNRPMLAQAAGADMFISIHVNAFDSNTSVAGPRMYYTKRTGLSYNAYNFATYFAEEFDDIRDVTQSENPDKLAYPHMKLARVASDEDLYGKGGYLAVLAAKTIPSVLIETGFITNDNDLMMLKSQWWQNYVGIAIADAVDAAYADGYRAK